MPATNTTTTPATPALVATSTATAAAVIQAAEAAPAAAAATNVLDVHMQDGPDRIKFWEFRLDVTNGPNNSELIPSLRKAVLDFLIMIKGINGSLTLLVYSPRQHTREDANELPCSHWTEELFPQDNNEIKKYIKDFKVKAPKDKIEYQTYLSIKLKMKGDQEEEEGFRSAVHDSLKAANNNYFRPCTLQFADQHTLGWWVNTHQYSNPEEFQDIMQTYVNIINRTRPNLTRRLTEPITFVIVNKFIWDGIRANERPQGWTGCYGLQVIVRKSQAELAVPIFKTATDMYNLSKRANIKLRFVNNFDYRQTPVQKRYEKGLLGLHKKSNGSMEHVRVRDFDDPDKAAKLAKVGFATADERSLTIRRALFYMTPRWQSGFETSPLFLSVEMACDNDGFYVTFPTAYAEEARDFLDALPMYVQKLFGQQSEQIEADILRRCFSLTGQERHEEMGWDQVTQRAISGDAQYYEDAIQDFQTAQMSWMGNGTLEEFFAKDAAEAASARPVAQHHLRNFDDVNTVATTGSNVEQRAELQQVIAATDCEAIALQQQQQKSYAEVAAAAEAAAKANPPTPSSTGTATPATPPATKNNMNNGFNNPGAQPSTPDSASTFEQGQGDMDEDLVLGGNEETENHTNGGRAGDPMDVDHDKQSAETGASAASRSSTGDGQPGAGPLT
jgi:hypothetical protein